MFNIRNVFAFAQAAQEAGQRVVLVTLYAVMGTSSRKPGTHLVVREDGAYAGSISDGCVEEAIVREALDLLPKGGACELRLGQNSPFIDIRLPCGGSIDLLLNELPNGFGGAILERIEARQAFSLNLPRGDGPIELAEGEEWSAVVLSAEHVAVSHLPPLRLAVLGDGPTPACLHDLAAAVGINTLVVSPNERLVDQVRERGHDAILLKGLSNMPEIPLDRRTACVLLFHDHEWESSLLCQILSSDAFYVGAMGSRKTHEQRQARLVSLQVPVDQIARIFAPIGLIPSLRDPETLAISALAQVVDRFNLEWGNV